MSTGRTVDIDPFGNRPLELFVSGHNALEHLRYHVLGDRERGEEHGWRLLIPALRAEMDAGHIDTLRDMARPARVETLPARLGPIYKQFLDRLEQTVEKAVDLHWHWEEVPGGSCRWCTFGTDGIFARLDEDYVHTGYLPEKNRDIWSDPATGTNPCYRLFLACLRRVQRMYNNGHNCIESISPAFLQLLQTGLTQAEWNARA
jgi:hypothetical protein